jgi:molybdopterin molybdotransferase
VLRPQEIGVLAALGQARVQVIRKPRVVVLSSGDELVGVEQALTPGKIRDVNRFTLAGLVDDFGGQAIRLPIARDTLESVERMFTDALLGEPDMIISSAGVSVGAADLIRDVLGKLGEMNFWRINLRPGKPLAFGHLGDIPFFGLPGNPVSAMVTFYVLVRPALLKQAGRSDYWPSLTATLEEPLSSDGRRSYIRVKLRQNDNGLWLASTTGTQSSGALMSMVLADGLMVIPEGQTVCNIGDKFHVYLLRDRIE